MSIQIAIDKLQSFLDLHEIEIDVSLIHDAIYFLEESQDKHKKRLEP